MTEKIHLTDSTLLGHVLKKWPDKLILDKTKLARMGEAVPFSNFLAKPFPKFVNVLPSLGLQ